jgi:membrane associated rhomboid family serine protease
LIFTFTVPGISMAGHLGGLAAGTVVAAGLAYAPQKNRNAVQTTACLVFAALLVVFTLARTASVGG